MNNFSLRDLMATEHSNEFWSFKSDWQLQAACGGTDPTRFEIPNKKALQTCATCPVRQMCLDHALASPWIPHGIWGGKLQNEVRRLWKKNHPRASRHEVQSLMGLVG